MKFSCDKHLIQSAAATAARAASAKSPIPALEGLLIQAGAGVRLTGYDLKKGIYTTIEAEVERPGSAVLNARLFTEMAPPPAGRHRHRGGGRQERRQGEVRPQRL